jgi:hypothetical protein
MNARAVEKTLYLALHDSPRTKSLPSEWGINTLKIPLKSNIYGSFKIKHLNSLYKFFKSIESNKTLIVEYDGNFVPIFVLAIVNLLNYKRFKIILDCHVNSYLDLRLFSIRTLIKILIIYFFKYVLRFKILVHNQQSLKIISGANYCPSPFPKHNFKNKIDYVTIPNSIFIISSLNKDEPIDDFLDAAVELDKLGFHIRISGNHMKLSENQLKKGNKFFTGFLKKSDYLVSLNEAELIVAMTNRKFNLLFAPREALINKKPCLINESNENREFYNDLCEYTETDANQIQSNIIRIFEKKVQFNESQFKFLVNKVTLQNQKIKKCLNIE